LNKWRDGVGKKYLHFGEMVAPYKINGIGANVFYMVGGREESFDKVLTSCWRASDNSIGQIIVNYNKYDITFDMEICECIIYSDDDVLNKPCKSENGVTLTVKALSAILVVKS
jgi:hypothetical protein